MSKLAMVALACGLVGCRIGDLDVNGKQCPCPAPWVCDSASNTCRASATSDAPLGDTVSIDAPAIVAMPACTGTGVIFCDNFNRTQPISAGDPTWASMSCDAGASLAVNGALEISYPQVTTGKFAYCALTSLTAASHARYQLDFDLDGTTSSASSDFVVTLQLAITLASPNADGIDEERFEMLISPDGHSNVSLIYHYPDAAKSPTGTNYPGYDLADNDTQPIFASGSKCHYTYIFEPVAHRAQGQSVCGAVTTVLTERTHTMATGLNSGPNLVLGFEDLGYVMPLFTLSYDNLVMRSL